MECAEEDDDEMVTCELEAAEALSRLARCSSEEAADAAASSSHPSQDPAIAVKQSCGYTTDTVTIAGNSEQTAQTACFHANTASKSRQNATEAKKEAQRLRRILANRKSARQTIRRRQAMYLDLTRKAADLTEENENLKKDKELALEEYNSLEGRNTILKAQMRRIEKAEQGEVQEYPKSPRAQAETSTCSATTSTPMFLYSQPSFVPCFWPSVLPSSDVIQFHYPDITSSSQLLMPTRDTQPCPHHGQEMGIPRPGTPFFVVPVPWLLPFLAQSTAIHTNDRQNEATSQTQQCSTCSSSDTLMLEEGAQLSLNPTTRTESSQSARALSAAQFSFAPDSGVHVPGLLSSGRPVESLSYVGISNASDNPEAYAVNAPEHMIQGLAKKSRDPVCKKPKDASAAAEARRRRKELLKLKNIHCHHHVYVCGISIQDQQR